MRVDENEIAAIAAQVRMREEEFIAQHTRLRMDRRGLSLMENADGSCEWSIGANAG